jgi:periplasmic copper chaperone A
MPQSHRPVRAFAIACGVLAAVSVLAAAPPAARPEAAPSAAAASTGVELLGAWARQTPPAAEVAAAYVEIRSRQADRLLEARTPAARRTEIHSTSMNDGVMEMRHVEALPIPAGTPVVLKPGGLHLMLFGLQKPLAAGQRLPLELRFEKAGIVRTEIVVRADDGEAHGHP